MFPNPKYHSSVSEGMKWLLEHVPYYGRWYRFLLFWPASDGLLPSLMIDPEWPHQDRSINEANDMMRQYFTDWIDSQVGDDAVLREKVVPKYPPFVKRMLQDNGSWLAAMKRDNVDLITEGITHVDESGISTSDGRHHDLDVIVFATGFHANKFLWPMDIVGRGGRALRDVWGEDPRAYLGITVPGFPNLFCLYGPGTNLAHAGSIIFHSECQVRYIMGCIKAMLEREVAAIDCKRSVHDAFNERLDEALSRSVWSLPVTNNWYKNADGRVTTTSPWRLLDYWRWTKAPDLEDYELR
jgi:4-hydroxyacetophenone monooxygenase